MMPTSNPFVLAPMAGVTDMPFRRLMKRMGAGTVISEFVSAHAIVHGGPKVDRYLAYHEEERPVGIQLFGGDPEILALAAQKVEARGVDFIDLNLGCPVPKVTKKGGGSAWLCRPAELGQLFGAVRKAIHIPLTVKIRSGWDAEQKNAIEVARIAHEEGVSALSIHGRTRTQGYAGQADWDFIADLVRESRIPIIGNGDIVSGALAASRLYLSGCAGVMIGRGALKNPWIFQEAVEAHKKLTEFDEEEKQALSASVVQRFQPQVSDSIPEGRHYYERKVKKLQPKPVSASADWIRIRADRDAEALIQLHLELLRESYPEERVKFGFRKFLAWYAAGYPGASQFRKFIFTHEVFSDIIEETLRFFEMVKGLGVKADDVRDEIPVLMSGHG